MAVTEKLYTSDGSTSYTFPFEYLKTTDVKVTVDGTAETNFTVPNGAPTTVQFNSGNIPASGKAIRIYRDTNVDNLSATFYAGSAIKSQDLNDNFNQNLYVTQEAKRDAATAWQDGDETIHSTETWHTSDDTKIPTTKAVENRIAAQIDTAIEGDVLAGTDLTKTQTGGQVTINHSVTGASSVDNSNGTVIQDLTINGRGHVTATGSIDLDTRYFTETEADARFQPKDAELTELATMGTDTASALADLTQAEVQILDGATVTKDELNILDGVTATKDEINILDGVTATKDELNILDGVTATKDEINILDGVTATKDEINILDGVTATKDELNILDGVTATKDELNKTDGLTATKDELNVLDGVTLTGSNPVNTSQINKLGGLNSSTTELNILHQKTFKTSSGTLDTTSDTEIPSSKVIAAHVASSQTAIGGFVTIADEVSFPNTQPANGVVVSINNAAGLVINGSGVSTSAKRADNTTVTINGFPSSLNSETLAAGVGLVVTSTSTANTYAYHKLLAAETDVKQLSDDINDFNARYRVASSAPGSSNDAGDMYFDTSANKMKVYNGTTNAWDDVASVGNFYINTLSSSSGTGGGNANFATGVYRFTLSNPPTMAQQLIVSINGVIQKPNAGTSQPSEGFAISGNDIIFAAAPAAGSDYFIVTQGSSVSIGTPSDNTVTSAKIVDGSIVNGDISSTANIAGSKVADDSIPEAKLDVHNAPATDKYLKYTSNGMEWADGASEGTDVKSTGESGTTKFLRVDGDGTCSWQVPPDTNTQVGGATGVDFNDNTKAQFGAGNDLQIYHDGTNNFISNADDEWLLIGNGGEGINLRATATEAGVVVRKDGASEMYHNGNKKIETTSAGINVTGAINVNGSALEAAPTFTATANGAITAEDAVILQTDGKVAKPVTYTSATGSIATIDSHQNEFLSAYDKVTGKVAFLMRESSGCSLIVGSVTNTGTSITFGTKVTVTTGSGEPLGFAFNNNTIVALYRKSSDCQAVAATVSGTTITLGSETEIDTADSYEQTVVYDSASDRWVLIWHSPNANKYRVAAVSGTTFTLGTTGTSVTTNTNAYQIKAVEAKSKGRILLTWIKSSSPSDPFMRVGQVNGGSTNTVTWGAETSMHSGNVYNHKTAIGWADSTNMGVFSWLENNNDLYVKGFKIDTSDNSIDQGTSEPTVTSSISNKYIDVVWNPEADQWRIMFIKDGSTGYGKYQDKVLGLTDNTAMAMTVGNGQEIGESTDELGTFNGGGRMAEYIGNSGVLVSWRDASGGSVAGKRYRIRRYGGGTMSSTQPYIGFAAGTVSDGQTCTVKVVGNTTTQSSLTIGRDYYVQSDGSISIGTTGTYKAGTAISTTKLLIR